MVYLTKKEREHKESFLQNYSKYLVDLYRQRKSLSDYYWLELDRSLGEDMLVLDAGAGKKGMLSLFLQRNITVVGLDISWEDLKKNPHLSHRVCGDAEHLPFKEGSFHLIVSQWLLEHLSSPRQFIQDASNTLQKNGLLLLISNSLYCPLMLFNALLPGLIRDRIKRAFLPKEVEEDTYPTHYRANTRRRLRSLVGDAGLEEKTFLHASDLSFFVFNRALFAFWLTLDRLTERELLKPLRMHFLGVYEK